MKRSPECSSAPGDRHDNDAPAVKKQRTTALSPSENSRAVKTSGLCTLQQEGLLHVQMDDDSKSIRAYPGFMLSALEKLQMDAHANDVEIRISVVVVVGKERSGTSTTVLHGIIGAFGDAVVRYEPCVYGSRTDGIEVSGVLLNGSEAGHIICVMEFHRFMSMNAVEFGSNLQRLAHTLLADTSIVIANQCATNRRSLLDTEMLNFISIVSSPADPPTARIISGQLIWLLRGAQQFRSKEFVSGDEDELSLPGIDDRSKVCIRTAFPSRYLLHVPAPRSLELCRNMMSAERADLPEEYLAGMDLLYSKVRSLGRNNGIPLLTFVQKVKSACTDLYPIPEKYREMLAAIEKSKYMQLPTDLVRLVLQYC